MAVQPSGAFHTWLHCVNANKTKVRSNPSQEKVVTPKGALSFKPCPTHLSPQMHTNTHTHMYSGCEVFNVWWWWVRRRSGSCGRGFLGGQRGRGGEEQSGVRLSEGGLRRVKGEFGAAEDGLLACRRRQRRLIHPGSCDGSSHGRSCRNHWPEGVQCGDWLGRNGGHGRDCRHARHTREGRHRTGCWVGILELRVLLQLLVVLCIVPKRGGKGGDTREHERGLRGERNGRTDVH